MTKQLTEPLNTIICFLKRSTITNSFQIYYYFNNKNITPNKNLFTTEYFLNNININNITYYITFNIIINDNSDKTKSIQYINKLNKLIKLNNITLEIKDKYLNTYNSIIFDHITSKDFIELLNNNE